MAKYPFHERFWLNVVFLKNGDLEYISKAYVHTASGKYKMSYDFLKYFRDLFPWPFNIERQSHS